MGAGANVTACIYFPTTPLHPLTFNFTTNEDACMNDGGTGGSLTVSTAGISQFSVGYVEAKNSGCKCISAASLWTLAYDVPGYSYSGSVQSQWYTPPEFNSIQLNNAGTTTVNTVAAKNSATYQQWHGTGDLFIIFNPVAAALLSTLPILKFFSPREGQEKIDEIYSPFIDKHYFDRLNEHFK